MTTNNSVGGTNKNITITEADMLELQKARAQSLRRKEYRAERNQRADVKMKNAEYHEKRNARLKAHDSAMQYLIENDLLAADVIEKLRNEVPEYADYMELYVEASQ